jgi:opacity protein-like surface antigen
LLLLQKKHPRFLPFRVLTLTICVVATAGIKPAAAQTSDPQPAATSTHTKTRFAPETDISLGIFGQLTPARIQTSSGTLSTPSDHEESFIQATQATTPSVGVLGTFHQQFKPWLGYNVNLGYSRFTENYSNGATYIATIGTNMYELSAASVVQGPRTQRFSTFFQTGGAILTFLPTQNPSPGAVQFRPALLFGVGFNYRLSEHLGVRAEYRGQFYKNPDFKMDLNKFFTVTNAPAVSLVYSFGGTSKRLKTHEVSH